MTIRTESEIIAAHDPGVRARAKLEMQIVNALITRAEEMGCELGIDEYIDDENDENDTGVAADFRSAVFDLDIANVSVYRDDEYLGWVCLVFGNDGWDLISDYSTHLEEWLKPVNDLAAEFS